MTTGTGKTPPVHTPTGFPLNTAPTAHLALRIDAILVPGRVRSKLQDGLCRGGMGVNAQGHRSDFFLLRKNRIHRRCQRGTAATPRKNRRTLLGKTPRDAHRRGQACDSANMPMASSASPNTSTSTPCNQGALSSCLISCLGKRPRVSARRDAHPIDQPTVRTQKSQPSHQRARSSFTSAARERSPRPRRRSSISTRAPTPKGAEEKSVQNHNQRSR